MLFGAMLVGGTIGASMQIYEIKADEMILLFRNIAVIAILSSFLICYLWKQTLRIYFFAWNGSRWSTSGSARVYFFDGFWMGKKKSPMSLSVMPSWY